ncbi:MAG: phospho-N-acetylmuramoyl-pentapeptide-transferase [Tissierellia bacterium]|nr:phospho-N-acetylmuramoyl-pentapeptide-transferase [Tissierellia bacterium]
MGYINILSFIIGTILSYIGAPIFLDILSKNKNTLGLNYKNDEIPICMGLLFIFAQTFNIGIIFFVLKKANSLYVISYLFVLTLMGLAGLLDDLIGDKKTKGFKGHIKSFLKGNLTTGGIKAGIGFVVALFISIIISNTIIDAVVNILIIALFTNLINLFDLRPGRAVKIFIFISIIMLYTSSIKNYNFLLYSFYGILLVYLPLDLKGKTMMGDVGANVLGVTLGVFCCFTHSLTTRYIYTLILIITHIMAERISFSKAIESNKLLNFIDNIGR